MPPSKQKRTFFIDNYHIFILIAMKIKLIFALTIFLLMWGSGSVSRSGNSSVV